MPGIWDFLTKSRAQRQKQYDRELDKPQMKVAPPPPVSATQKAQSLPVLPETKSAISDYHRRMKSY